MNKYQLCGLKCINMPYFRLFGASVSGNARCSEDFLLGWRSALIADHALRDSTAPLTVLRGAWKAKSRLLAQFDTKELAC